LHMSRLWYVDHGRIFFLSLCPVAASRTSREAPIVDSDVSATPTSGVFEPPEDQPFHQSLQTRQHYGQANATKKTTRRRHPGAGSCASGLQRPEARPPERIGVVAR